MNHYIYDFEGESIGLEFTYIWDLGSVTNDPCDQGQVIQSL